MVELVPAIYRDKSTPERDVQTAFWVDDNHFIYGFVNKGLDISPDQNLQWMAYDITAQTEQAIPSPMKFDESFWKRNNIEKVNRFPELTDHFSPSGRYVIYKVSYGSHFDQNSRTEIWVAETHGQDKFKIHEFGFAGVAIGNIAWFDGEKKILFDLGFEGPSEYYVTDIPSRTTTPLNIATEFSSELSPDRTTLAFIPSGDWRLSLFSLRDKSVRAIEQSGGREPHWSADGKLLYYWGSTSSYDPFAVTEIRAYNTDTGRISTVIDQPSLVWGFRNYEGDNINVGAKYYLGYSFAMSPNGNGILLWDNGFYLVMKK